ncbi:MAG TPA: DivIVA domain-containing protein [Solirubrobacteraceae bacterium]|nr:DivIVA domain-containing protein [Solirubrobacteraceae bacterium]
MTDFERSGERAGVTYDEPARRRSPGTFFADLGDKLARGFNGFDRPQPDEGEWEPYEEELDQPTEAVDTVPSPEPTRKRFPTALHGYDRDAVEDYIDGLEHEIGQMAAKLSAQRSPTAAIEAELARVGEETSAILRVAHEQAAEITRRARVEADRCVQDAAANAVAMTEDAKRKLRQLDSETDAVWAERMRLIEDIRHVATSLFSLAEDASDRFPEDGDKPSPSPTRSSLQTPSGPAQQASPTPQHKTSPAQGQQQAAPKPVAAPESSAPRPQPAPAPPQAARPAGTPPPATPAAAAPRPMPAPVRAQPPVGSHSPIAAHDHRGGPASG